MFTAFVRRHHCRSCGLSLCDEHSSQRAALPHLGITEPVCVVMAHIVMAYAGMAYIVTAYIVMAYIVVACLAALPLLAITEPVRVCGACFRAISI